MPPSSKQDASKLTETLRELLEEGDASVVETEGKVIRRIHPTKIGQRRGKNDIIGELNKFLRENDFVEDKTKRIYRRKKDLFDPGADPKAEVNLLTSKLTPRVSRQHVAIFNACADHFDNKREALERAIELLAQETGVQLNLDPD